MSNHYEAIPKPQVFTPAQIRYIQDAINTALNRSDVKTDHAVSGLGKRTKTMIAPGVIIDVLEALVIQIPVTFGEQSEVGNALITLYNAQIATMREVREAEQRRLEEKKRFYRKVPLTAN